MFIFWSFFFLHQCRGAVPDAKVRIGVPLMRPVSGKPT
jgi:hypothetical protein